MEVIKTKKENFTIRFAEKSDMALILNFIRELADYENLLDEVVATEEVLMDSLFHRKAAEVIIGEYNGEPIGFALFFHNFSTFLGKPGIYLEDLYIKLEMRGNGYGRTLLAFLADLALKRNCGRFEWWCLDWNKSSIDFYKSIGAISMEDWTVYRMTDKALEDLAKEFYTR